MVIELLGAHHLFEEMPPSMCLRMRKGLWGTSIWVVGYVLDSGEEKLLPIFWCWVLLTLFTLRFAYHA